MNLEKRNMKKIDFTKSKARGANLYQVTENQMKICFSKHGGGVTLEGAAYNPKKKYLIGFIEILEEHSLPLMLRFYTAENGETEKVYIRFVLLPRVKTKVCFELNCVDCSNGTLDRPPGMLKQVVYGTRTRREDVRKIELGIKEAFHDVRICLENFYVSDEKPSEFRLPSGKLVDPYGQWKLRDWPGKIRGEEELAAVMWANEGEASYPFANWNRFGGDFSRKLTEGTGFFASIKTTDGRWHLTDPEGYDYFSMGVCCVRPGQAGDITGFSENLDIVPKDGDEFLEIKKHPWFDHTICMYDYGGSNLKRVYGEQWEEKWREITGHILMGHGINSMGNGSDPARFQEGVRIPYTRQLAGFPTTDINIFRDFPDVLSPQYEKNSQKFAEGLRPWKGDRWMIGYFLRNEPGFGFIAGVAVANEVLHNPEKTYCREGLISFLKERYGAIENLNAAWDSDFSSFMDLEKPIDDCMTMYPASEPDLREYSRFLVGEYCRIPSEACRKVDSDHMNLGMRWAKMNNRDMLAGWEYFDVFSFNCYSIDPEADMEFIQSAGIDRPLLIGEYHCGALDRGLPATGLKGVENQTERGIMWRMFVEKTAANPGGVGAHWFQYQDEFCLGRFDGENYQIGLVDICMQPYPEMMEAIKATAEELYAVKNGEKEPFSKKPKTIPMVG